MRSTGRCVIPLHLVLHGTETRNPAGKGLTREKPSLGETNRPIANAGSPDNGSNRASDGLQGTIDVS
jgi:hypothetical protein